MTKLESEFQAELVVKLKEMFPGCMVQKLDTSYQQGIPDLLLLFEDMWATLEVKQFAKAKTQPNQPYWVAKMNSMSFSAFIYPENEKEVLDALQSAFRAIRAARLSQRK